jgi:predicted 3-demethylubiquinone-9 3-methyltransferase (glyoxalase superfamily)
MSQISTCLWFDGKAEEAARFYTSILPDSRIEAVLRSPLDTPGGKAGEVLLVEFTINGRHFQGLNGGPGHPFTQAISMSVLCEDQAEVDRVWDALLDGGSPVQCGWLTDRYGLSWQVVPRRMIELLHDPNPKRVDAAMRAMMEMIKLDVAELDRAADAAG